MRKRSTLSIIVIMLVLSLACQALVKPATPTPERIVPSATDAPVSTSTPLIGLVYGTRDDTTGEQALWQIGEDGAPHMILSGYDYAEFSPDGTQAAYYDNVFESGSGCTWLADFAEGQVRPLDCVSTVSIDEASFPASVLSWPQNDPDTLIAILNQTGGGMGGSSGYLGTISLKDGTKKILDPRNQIQNAELSPDGKFIAYGSYDVQSFRSLGWLYSADAGVVQFDPKAYGADYPQVDNPSWSPDQKQIAWGLMGKEFDSAIGVFDLESKTANILHSYQQGITPDMRPTPPAPVWNSDGQWLIVEINAQGKDGQNDVDQSGDWLFRADGSEKYKVDGNFISLSPDNNWVLIIGRGADKLELRVSRLDGSDVSVLGEVDDYVRSALWSPDGRTLAFVDAGQKIHFTETAVWDVYEATGIEASSDISLIDWVPPIQSTFESLTVLPTPTQSLVSDFSCPNAPPTRLQIGATGRVTYTDGSTIRLRSAPEAGDNVIDQLPEGTEFEVIEGPVCTPRIDRTDAFVYWKVKVPLRNGISGWVAEGSFTAYFIEPWP